MKGAGGPCKYLGIIFILSLLIQGICAAQANNETGSNLNNSINSTINGTITGNLNGTLNNTTNETFNGTVIGTINGTLNGTISNTQVFPRILLLPLFLGSLLFLCWLCRFFDRMNFCFVSFLLIALLLGLLWRSQLRLIALILEYVPYILIVFIFSFIIIIIYYEDKKRKEKKGNNKDESDEKNKDNEEIGYEKNEDNKKEENNGKDENGEKAKSNLIMWLHDIARNFIIIFVVLVWPIVLLYFDYRKIDYITFYGIEKLQFPVYIIAASFVGILSYLFLSIEERFNQLIPEYMKISIAWSYLKRILTAPFIAIVGFYLLNHLLRIEEINEVNDYFVFVFSFFAGVFTKTIETWIFAWVQKLLPGDKKDEFDSRFQYKVENSLFVVKLRLDEDLAYMLHSVRIRTIEDLASFYDKEEHLINKIDLDTRNLGEGTGCPAKRREKMLGSYRKKQLEIYTKRAYYYTKMDEKNDLVKYLKMDRDLAFKLCIRADIKDLDSLINCDPKYVHKKICDYKTESKEAHDMLCECSEEIIQKFKEKAKLELEKIINPLAAFSACPMSGKAPMTVKFTDESTGNPISWDWNFGDNTNHSKDKDSIHTYSNPGSCTVILKVENAKGSSTLRKEIEVK